MIDQHGFRLNVGIILCNAQQQLFWGRRYGHENAWQFPQGGIKDYETLEEAMYRELGEELGLMPEDVKIMGVTKQWLYYRLPRHLRRYYTRPVCIGQRQKWFLLRLESDDSRIRFDLTDSPEFDIWHWVNYWRPAEEVISFKRQVYQRALREFEPLLFG